MATAKRGPSSPVAGCTKALVAGLSAAGVFACGTARAQVLEIEAGGHVRTYDRPAVFDGKGAAAIASPRLRVQAAGKAHPAMIAEASRATDVGEDLIAAVAWAESRMRAGAVSPKGARGEMQLMPDTARALGVDASDSRENYRGGGAYLHRLLIRYDGDLVRALAAYNAGPGAVDRYGGVPPFPETRAYVAAVLDRLSREAEMTQ